MRTAPLIAIGLALTAGSAFAESAKTTTASSMPPAATDTTPPATTTPSTTPPSSTTPETAPPSSSTAPAPPTSATNSNTAPSIAQGGANAATPAALTAGESVKDNTGANIGQVAGVSTNASGQQMATIKMGADTFQVEADRLGSANGSATINMTKAQIDAMLHPSRTQ